MNAKKSLVGVAIAATAVVLGIGAGAAVANVPAVLSPKGLSAGKGEPTIPMPAPTYSKNSSGLTYGSAADADSPTDEPDLIQVDATNGKTGYVLKTDLDAVDGTDAQANFKSPADALAWQNSQAAREDHTIPVYAVDGTTVIGEFVVAGIDSQQDIASTLPTPGN